MRSHYEDNTKIILAIGLCILGFGLPLLKVRNIVGLVLLGFGISLFSWGCLRLFRLNRK